MRRWNSRELSAFSRRLLSAWFDLTEHEQKAVVVVLALFLLGVVVRAWHLAHLP